MKKLIMIAVAALLFTGSNAKYPVLSRSAERLGIFGAYKVSSTLATFNLGGQTVTGYDVKCSGSGWVNCPKLGAEYLPSVTTSEWDMVQIDQTDGLMAYALGEISEGTLEGKYSVSVQVEGEESMRIYSVEWSSDNESGADSQITVYRDDV